MSAEMLTWWARNQARIIFGLRMVLAGLLSYAVSELAGFDQSYWAVLSAVIVIQGSIGGSIIAAMDRLAGTVGGAIWGAVVAIVIHHDQPGNMELALALALVPLSILTGYRPAYRVAPITAIIVLMAAQPVNPFISALNRITEIALGSGIAVAIVLIIFPARASRMLSRNISTAAKAMAQLISVLNTGFDRSPNLAEVLKIQDTIGKSVASTEAIAAEAKLELATHIASGPDPEPVVRTLRRLRHDLAVLGRATRSPLPEEVRQRLSGPIMGVFNAMQAQLEKTSESLGTKKPAPPLDALRSAIAAYSSAFGHIREGGVAQQIAPEVMERVFALSFLFDQIKKNLMDLADRTNELAN